MKHAVPFAGLSVVGVVNTAPVLSGDEHSPKPGIDVVEESIARTLTKNVHG